MASARFHNQPGLPPRLQGGEIDAYLVMKLGVLVTSLFVFFTTTMSVSFTLRETQARMFKFTVQLQHAARHRRQTAHSSLLSNARCTALSRLFSFLVHGVVPDMLAPQGSPPGR